MNVYNLRLALKNPIYESPLDFRKDNIRSALMEGEYAFNERFGGMKVIQILSIEEEYIDVKLEIDEETSRPLKQLSYFSRRLKPILGEYSSTEKIFKLVSFKQLVNGMPSNMIPMDGCNNIDFISDEILLDTVRFIIATKDVGSHEMQNEKKAIIETLKRCVVQVL